MVLDPRIAEEFIKACVPIQLAAYDNAVARGFWEEPTPTVGDKVALMHSELSELLEEYRAGHAMTEVYFEHASAYARQGLPVPADEKPEGVGIELADLIIRAFDFAGRYEIPLAANIVRKMNHNSTRPYKHGGKLI